MNFRPINLTEDTDENLTLIDQIMKVDQGVILAGTTPKLVSNTIEAIIKKYGEEAADKYVRISPEPFTD